MAVNEQTPKTACSALNIDLKQNRHINHGSVDGNVLATILNAKVAWLEKAKSEKPLASFIDNLENSEVSFYKALRVSKIRFILECKKASPSKGLIRASFVPEEIAAVYDNYAAAISVLTDEKFFQGSYSYITRVKKQVHVPVLCKDFIYDPYQIYLARYSGADAILLMLSVLTDEAYMELSQLAHSFNMGVLTEASTPEEIARAIALDAQVIGINNRNLRNLTVDLNRVRELSKLVPQGRVVISESGIYTHDQVLELSQYVKGFLVGSALTEQSNIDLACRKLVYGENKVCGITRTIDAIASWHAGTVYNGFIFAESSPRYVTPEHARQIVSACRSANCAQKFVGVFVNDTIENITDLAVSIPLAAVQLHGSESIEFVKELRKELPKNCEIWKAIPVENEYPALIVDEYLKEVNRVVLDTKNNSGFGGTGASFDWSLITANRSRIIVAGGLNPNNILEARDISKAVGFDLNSGVEESAGIKDIEKINTVFGKLKDF